VLTYDGHDVAAAQLHKVTDSVMQVVYWGDAPGYDRMRPMNMLAPEVFGYCRDSGITTLDIGPSSDAGTPSEGLCSFKESLGCRATLKPRFRI
jgi:lipid II:glycine glycyltransferase (peptidoglycan interpeptide bridge formation enzyme)